MIPPWQIVMIASFEACGLQGFACEEPVSFISGPVAAAT